MVTYLYWALVVGLTIGVVVVVGVRMDNLKGALAGAAVVLLTGWAAYYFYFQQVFVKRWGGVMTISVPKGQYHVTTTWKDDNLWVENYDPATNSCVFSEYSRGNLLQGRVTIRNCNPLGLPFGSRNDARSPIPQTGVLTPFPALWNRDPLRSQSRVWLDASNPAGPPNL